MLEFKVPYEDEYGEDFNYVTTIYKLKDGYIPAEEYAIDHIGGFHGHGTNAVDAVQKCLDSV